MWQDMEDKKEDRKMHKGKKGVDKDAEVRAERHAGDPNQDEAGEASHHASPPAAAQLGGRSSRAGQGVSTLMCQTAEALSSTVRQKRKSSHGQCTRRGGKRNGSSSSSSQPLVAAKGALRKGPPSCPVRQDRSWRGAPGQAAAHTAGTAAEADTSERHSVGTAQHKARRGHKAPNPQPAGRA